MVASGELASWLVYLVCLNKASMPNFSIVGSLEVAQIYLSGWVGGWVCFGGWVGGVTRILRESQFGLTRISLLELSVQQIESLDIDRKKDLEL